MRQSDKPVRSGRSREWKERPNTEDVTVWRGPGYPFREQATGSLRLSENPLGLSTGSLWGDPLGG